MTNDSLNPGCVLDVFSGFIQYRDRISSVYHLSNVCNSLTENDQNRTGNDPPDGHQCSALRVQ